MNDQTLQENVRTLAAIIGKNEKAAAELLNTAVAIVFDKSDPVSTEFANFLYELLKRTIKTVSINPAAFEKETVPVIIGAVPVVAEQDGLFVKITSGRLIVSSNPIGTEPAVNMHPILLLLGACYTAAQVIKKIVGDMLPVPQIDPLQIDFETVPGENFSLEESFDIGTTYLAGAGAIGNGFVWGLSLLNPVGELHVADPDTVDHGNLNRCKWFSEIDVGYNKAERLVELAQSEFKSLKLIAHPSELQKVSTRTEGAWLKRLVIGVDSRRVRRNLQNEIPGEAYDASTTDIREVVLHFNRQPLEGLACLSCIYFQDVAESAHELHVAEALGVSVEDVQANYVSLESAQKIHLRYPDVLPENIQGQAYDSLFKQLCGEGALRTPEDRQVLAPFSFVSVLAGVYLAIEFVKRISAGNPINNFNYWRISPWAEPVLRAKKIRSNREGCEFCSNKILLQVADSLWGKQ